MEDDTSLDMIVIDFFRIVTEVLESRDGAHLIRHFRLRHGYEAFEVER